MGARLRSRVRGGEHVAKETVRALAPHKALTKTMTNDNGLDF
ncbi:hypothetical protein AKJ09_04095 [Labilithrix luteola]|uniref:Uncharacterized protein n=1 Tax=Labilithrix luteola TaxID=1391654 RepID=A0A0K1PVM8_9BACT|nr:hypothetical protein AKJ09_04095 [Labilithrix luteola]